METIVTKRLRITRKNNPYISKIKAYQPKFRKTKINVKNKLTINAPKTPSHVLFGLICTANFFLPKKEPKINAAVSAIHAIKKTDNKNNRPFSKMIFKDTTLAKQQKQAINKLANFNGISCLYTK